VGVTAAETPSWRDEPPQLPEATLRRIWELAGNTRRQARADGERYPEGTRDQALASLGGSMRRRGMTESEIEAALLMVNRQRCDPPLDARDVRRIARSVSRYEATDPVLARISRGEVDVDEESVTGVSLSGVPESWQPLDTDALEARPPAPPEIVRAVGRGALLYRGRTHLLSGPPESGKSWLALIAAAEVLAAGGTVVWIDTDGQGWSDTLERLRTLSVSDEARQRLHYMQPDEPATRDGIARLAAHLLPTLVVVDSWNPALAIQGCSALSTDDVEKWNQTVLRPWGTDITVVLVDHVTKDPERRGAYSYGSERKSGLVQVHISMDVASQPLSRETAGTYKVYAKKDRPGWHDRAPGTRYVGDLVLRPADGRIEYELRLGRPGSDDKSAPEEWHPTGIMERVSEYVSEAGGEVPSSEIVAGVRGRREHVLHALRVLSKYGYLGLRHEGAARMYRHVCAYREGDPLEDFPRGPLDGPQDPSEEDFGF